MSEVYKAIAIVQGELAKTGISKNRKNEQQRYMFRGIDDVYAALAPLLSKHGLVVVPRCLERECIEGQTRKGDPLFRVTVKAEFDFISSTDGSKHTACTFGEAMDSADKATNKAMSAAYKYAAFMTFAIPTEGDNDADAQHHEPAPAQAKRQEKKLDGKYTSMSALEKAIKEFVTAMGTVANHAEWYALKNDSADLLAQAQRDKEDWWNGWAKQPDGFTPLKDRIASLEAYLDKESGAGEFDGVNEGDLK